MIKLVADKATGRIQIVGTHRARALFEDQHAVDGKTGISQADFPKHPA